MGQSRNRAKRFLTEMQILSEANAAMKSTWMPTVSGLKWWRPSNSTRCEKLRQELQSQQQILLDSVRSVNSRFCWTVSIAVFCAVVMFLLRICTEFSVGVSTPTRQVGA